MVGVAILVIIILSHFINMKAKILLMISACTLSACAYYPRIPKSVKKSFTYCYDNKYTGIDTLINTNGYYKEMILIKKSPTIGGFLKDTSIYYIDTSYNHFMFYNNGMFVYNIHNAYYDDRKKTVIKKDILSLMKIFSQNSEAPGANYFYGNNWGRYIICEDTIKVQQIHKGQSLNDSWHLSEKWYKIIDKNTILCINLINLPTSFHPQSIKRIQYPIVFVPIPAKPKPNKSWILKEKWFWCNEEDWKTHVESLEKK
ncbi:MAG: hypothetical protein LBU91_00975 [Bacteroidales bacterium]|jgi:hypothetical protein|nr:hypothetical protein [Bacteroidales bacterium]